MSPFPINLEKEATTTKNIRVELEPAGNCFGSMLLLSKDEQAPGIHPWVEQTRSQMSPEMLARHRLVTLGLFYAAVPRQSWDSFSAYLDQLKHAAPAMLREMLLSSYARVHHTEVSQTDIRTAVNWAEVLSSPSTYLAFLNQRFGAENIDDELETRAYHYVLDPPALKQLLVEHLGWFWKNYLEEEWTRVRPMLDESVRSFKQADLSRMTRLEATRFVTGQNLEETKWVEMLDRAEQIVFIPNAHIGPYVHKGLIGNVLQVYFGARQPEGGAVRIPDLDRAEIAAQLSALADDTRLRILSLIAEREQVRAQDLMDATGLSQPSISRYLGQLTAAGYLQERRVNGAKAYTLNQDRIEKTLKAASSFLLKRG